MTPSNQLNTLYAASGRLKVKAQGYWYTGGGTKGSFGYYPHLKDPMGMPVYPDTQVRGDLKIAAEHYINQTPGAAVDIDAFFGREGYADASPLKMTDLELTAESKNRWQSALFQIKTRIKIDDGTRTVAEHFLVDLELAYLDGLELESVFHIGYFTDESVLKRAMTALEEMVDFLPGFGAFRSRGFGWGIPELTMEPLPPVTYSPPGKPPQRNQADFNYFLTAMGHVRNKRPGTGSLQQIETMNHLTSDQLRGWFVRTWEALFGGWPDEKALRRIRFRNLYPSDPASHLLGFPPPATTLIDEEKRIKDMWRQGMEAMEPLEQENYVRCKTKPLPDTFFVTQSDPVQMIKIHKEKRIRNRLNRAFVTDKDALFVQEFIPRGTTFGAHIVIDSTGDPTTADPEFVDKALFIFENINPLIKGTFFTPVREEKSENNAPVKTSDDSPLEASPFPALVISPVPWDMERMMTDNSIKIETIKGYNTVLKRPKRNRIGIAPSSVIMTGPDDPIMAHCIAWKGFGVQAIANPDCDAPSDKSESKDENRLTSTKENASNAADGSRPEIGSSLPNSMYDEKGRLIRISKSDLRDWILPTTPVTFIENTLKRQLKKYEEKGKESHKALAGITQALLTCLEDEGIEAMRQLINTYLEELAVENWKQRTL